MTYFDQIQTLPAEFTALLLKGTLDPNLQMALFKTNVSIVNLEASYHCNRKCDYCPVANSQRSSTQKTMAENLIEKIASELSLINYENRVSFNLYNEPLADPDLEEKIKVFRKKLPYSWLMLNSNGDYLTVERLSRLSDAGLNSLVVTLHPKPFATETGEKRTKRISKLLKKCEIESEAIDLSNGQITLNKFGIFIKVQWPNWREHGLDRGGAVKKLSTIEIRTAPCAKPFREFTIYYDGTIQPCCESFYDGNKTPVDLSGLNVEDSTIFQAYSSKELSTFRTSLFTFGPKNGICSHCKSVDYSNRDRDKLRRDFLVDQAVNLV